ncbi:MAG: PQQ-binding-like beta-propeller repeat protein [Candidatus Bathyarchaeia archaeon]
MSKKAVIAVTVTLFLVLALGNVGLEVADANPLPPDWMNPEMNITIPSPQNESTNTLPVLVEFTAQSSSYFFLPANESEGWINGFFYALDGQNMTSGVRFTEVQGPKAVQYSIATDHNFSGQVELTDLTEGSHNITVYWGALINNASVVYNANWSATTQFNVKTEKTASTASIESLTTAADLSDSNDWPMFHHDVGHTGFSSSSGPKTNQTRWFFTTGGAIETSPVVVDGRVYFGSDDGSIYAVDAQDGTLIWDFTTEGPARSSPAVVNGVVYAGGYRAHMVFAINASTGDLLWKSPINSLYPNTISATTVANDVVYVSVYVAEAGHGGELYALNMTTGKLLWIYDPSAWISSSPAVADGVVYIGSSRGLEALDAITGAAIWNGNIDAYGIDALTVDEGLVYAGATTEVVQAFNAYNGAFVWNGSVSGGCYMSCPAVANGMLYVCTTYGGSSVLHAGGVFALDAATGALRWNQTIGSISQSSPAVADGIVYVGSDDTGPSYLLNSTTGHKIYALNATTGAIIWTYTTGGIVKSSPAVADGVLYVGSSDSKLYAIGEPPKNENDGQAESPFPTASLKLSPSPTIPEFSPWMSPLFVASTLLIICWKRKTSRQ